MPAVPPTSVRLVDVVSAMSVGEPVPAARYTSYLSAFAVAVQVSATCPSVGVAVNAGVVVVAGGVTSVVVHPSPVVTAGGVVVVVPPVVVVLPELLTPWQALDDALTQLTSDDADSEPAAEACLLCGKVAIASSVWLSKLVIWPPACCTACCAWLNEVPALKPMYSLTDVLFVLYTGRVTYTGLGFGPCKSSTPVFGS